MKRMCWAVTCKNNRAHKQNHFHGHRIPLKVTEALAPRPSIGDRLTVQCNDCGKLYSYESEEVLRFELEVPDSFIPHPAFRAGKDSSEEPK